MDSSEFVTFIYAVAGLLMITVVPIAIIVFCGKWIARMLGSIFRPKKPYIRK
jgi:hypothetical protein